MAQSPEAEVLTALAATLETGLAGTPPGSWTYERPPDVRRAPLPPPGTQMKPGECPIVYVIPGAGSMLSGGHFNFALQQVSYRYDFHVDILGIVFREASAGVLADDERLNLRHHCATILMKNRHIGSLSKDGIIIGDGRAERVDEGEYAPAAIFVLPITIPLAQAYSTVP